MTTVHDRRSYVPHPADTECLEADHDGLGLARVGRAQKLGTETRIGPTGKSSSRTGGLAMCQSAHVADLGPVAGPPGPIRTSRLVLREPEARDRVAVIELFASPAVGTSVEVELVALDVLHQEARLVVLIGRQ